CAQARAPRRRSLPRRSPPWKGPIPGPGAALAARSGDRPQSGFSWTPPSFAARMRPRKRVGDRSALAKKYRRPAGLFLSLIRASPLADKRRGTANGHVTRATSLRRGDTCFYLVNNMLALLLHVMSPIHYELCRVRLRYRAARTNYATLRN